MSTTGTESYITHANDTFVVEVSGCHLNELLAQPHNRASSRICRKLPCRYGTQTGRTVERHCVKNRRKKRRPLWVGPNAVPMIREGRVTGYVDPACPRHG